MQEESTTGLQNILNETGLSQLHQYIDKHAHSTSKTDIFSEYIAEKKDISVSQIIANCQGLISKSYAYDILAGKKTHPSRDMLLILCVAAHMNRKLVRRVLEIYNHRDLYAKDTRDIIIATYINNHNYDLNQINEKLVEYNLKILGNL